MQRNEIFKVSVSDEKYGVNWKKFIYIRVINARSHAPGLGDHDVPTEDFWVDLRAIDESSTDHVYPLSIKLQDFMDMYRDEEILPIDDGDKAFIILRYREF